MSSITAAHKRLHIALDVLTPDSVFFPQFDSSNHAKIYFNTGYRSIKPKYSFIFIHFTLYKVSGSCYIASLLCQSFVLSVFFREPPAFSHSVWPCQRKNAPCRDNKGYLKCDTVFQRMGGGGKKKKEKKGDSGGEVGKRRRGGWEIFP